MPPLRKAIVALAALVAVSSSGCSVESPTPSLLFPTVRPTPISPAHQLLATLPTEAGGRLYDHYEIVDDSVNVGKPVDQVLTALGKNRADAVSVFRWTDEATIGAVVVEGVDGGTLLQAFVDNWQAAAVIRRWQRPAAGSMGWGLAERGGVVTVVYQRANIVYLVSTPTPDPAKLAAILADMPLGGP